MSPVIESIFHETPVVPLIQADDPGVALETAHALANGGLNVFEVVMRTPAALECLAAITSAHPRSWVGAGTVLNAEQAHQAADAGARFIVSPGLHESVVAAAMERGLPVYPGVATASEVQRAWNLGLRTVKFFPASLAGGTPMIKALASVFGGMRFMPTGGISATNLVEYLALPAVIACGGSWLTPESVIADKDYAAVTTLAEQAVAIARKARGRAGHVL